MGLYRKGAVWHSGQHRGETQDNDMKWRRPQIDPKSNPLLAKRWVELCALHWPERTLEFNIKEQYNPDDDPAFRQRKLRDLSGKQ